MNNIVAIVGRPNVGKSTLFNRIIGQRQAIVDDVSGVTRDRIYGIGEWNGKTFNVVDTGGFVKNSDDVFEAEIRKQVLIALQEASVIVFVADVTTGITDLDYEVAEMLRRSGKNALLAVNKVDNGNRLLEAQEFWSLGFEYTFFISSINGGGTGELLDEIAVNIKDDTTTLPAGIPKFAIVGRPNVGKSSMLNVLIGEERNIVTDIPGTTRDSIHTYYNLYNKEFYLIDTAGIRKRSKVDEDIEFYSVIRAIKTIEDADVCILMFDVVHGLESQDLKIFSIAANRKKGVVLVANKWDLITKETNTLKKLEDEYRKKLAPFSDVPVVFTSVTEKQRIHKVIESALAVYERRRQQLNNEELNEFIMELTDSNPPPTHRGQFIKFYKAEQVRAQVPTIIIYCNYPLEVAESYRRFLENKLRAKYDFTGSPLIIIFRKPQ
jgi:GTP-binding protein